MIRKTFAQRIADALAANLPEGSPFTITGHAPGWHGYFFVTHTNGVAVQVYVHRARHHARRVTDSDVWDASRAAWHQLRGSAWLSPEWQAKHTQAAADWAETYGITIP